MITGLGLLQAMAGPGFVVLLLCALVLAGSLDPVASESGADVRVDREFSFLVGAGVPGTGGGAFIGLDASRAPGARITVPEGASQLTLDSSWTCLPEDCALPFTMTPPSAAGPEETLPGSEPPGPADIEALLTSQHDARGEGSASWALDNPEPGLWKIGAVADTVALQAEGSITLVASIAS